MDDYKFQVTVIEWMPGRYATRYDGHATGAHLFRLRLHEFVEVLTIRAIPSLFDGTTYAAPINFNGAVASGDLRHLVAEEVVKAVTRSLRITPKTKQVGRLQPTYDMRYAERRVKIVREPFYEDEVRCGTGEAELGETKVQDHNSIGCMVKQNANSAQRFEVR